MTEKFFLDKAKLAEILRFYGLKISDFNRKIDAKNRELYQISAGNQVEFSRDMLKAIAKACPEVSLFWLITGEGSMLAGSIEQHNINGDNIGQQTNHTPNADSETIASQQRTIERLSKVIEKLSDK